MNILINNCREWHTSNLSSRF